MGATTQTIDYAAVLADLKARRAQLDAAIAGIEASLLGSKILIGTAAVDISTSPTPAAVNTQNVSSIQSDTFFNLSIVDATKKFLAMRKGVATTVEITDALRRGGQINAGQETFPVTLTSILHRGYRQGAGVIRTGRGTWGLSEWYPNKAKKPSNDE